MIRLAKQGEAVNGDTSAMKSFLTSQREAQRNHVELANLLCTAKIPTASGVCGAQVPGTTVVGYHDTEHLKLVGSVYMWPHLCAAFRQLSFF